jgi:hypothetical protein
MIQTKPKHFRKQLILPAEHGSWAWLLVPYFVGTAVAGTFNLGTALVLIGGLALFLLRQPATIWLRIRQGRGRRSDEAVVARLVAGLSALAILSLAGLLMLGLTAVLWLALPVAGLLAVYLAAALSRQTSTRTLWMELAGAAGLALMAPAAMIAVDGRITLTTWLVWLLMALQNVLGVLYVRLRIADTHEREADRRLMLVGHLVGLVLVLGTAVLGYIPLLATLPFLGFCGRAMWTYVRPRPIANIKKFGFSEVGIEIISGLIIILAYANSG